MGFRIRILAHFPFTRVFATNPRKKPKQEHKFVTRIVSQSKKHDARLFFVVFCCKDIECRNSTVTTLFCGGIGMALIQAGILFAILLPVGTGDNVAPTGKVHERTFVVYFAADETEVGVSVEVQNLYDQPLLVDSARLSCGCMDYDLKQPLSGIAPLESANATVRIKPSPMQNVVLDLYARRPRRSASEDASPRCHLSRTILKLVERSEFALPQKPLEFNGETVEFDVFNHSESNWSEVRVEYEFSEEDITEFSAPYKFSIAAAPESRVEGSSFQSIACVVRRERNPHVDSSAAFQPTELRIKAFVRTSDTPTGMFHLVNEGTLTLWEKQPYKAHPEDILGGLTREVMIVCRNDDAEDLLKENAVQLSNTDGSIQYDMSRITMEARSSKRLRIVLPEGNKFSDGLTISIGDWKHEFETN